MGYAAVTNRFSVQEQIATTLAGGGVNVAAVIGIKGGYVRVHITATVACFLAFGATATNAAGATGYPLAANVEYIFDGPISALAFNGAAAGTVAIFGVA